MINRPRWHFGIVWSNLVPRAFSLAWRRGGKREKALGTRLRLVISYLVGYHCSLEDHSWNE